MVIKKNKFIFFDAHILFFLTLIHPFVTLNGPWGALRLGRTADGGTGPGTAALKPRHRGAAAGGSARTEPYKHGDTHSPASVQSIKQQTWV